MSPEAPGILDCRVFFDAVFEKATAMGAPVAAAVVDAAGHLIALERMPDAGFITPEIAIAKAYTMAAFRSMSPRFPDGKVIQQWFKERNPQMLANAAVFTNGKIVASGGCSPIFRDDRMIGAFGISGATGDQDEEMARYARDRAGWANVPAHDDTPDSVREHVNAIYGRIGLADRSL